ncbi:MAG: hypothetical protein JW395_4160 [Nitrospira sp.]|nr:hypothetical protein [Nitrospira sp.]
METQLLKTVFSERLAPLRARMQASRATVRPVSRTWFELSDKAAFDTCVELCLKWMGPRSQVKLPDQAWKGEAFDVTDVMGANPAKAVRISGTDGAVWAARLDWPDPENPRTWISEFFAERRSGQLSRFGAQLTCVIRGEAAPFDFSRPTVVRHVLESLSAEADGWSLPNAAVRIGKSEVSDFVGLLYEPNRRLPVITISESESGVTRIPPDELAQTVAGAAHIIHLSADASWELTRSVGKRMSVYNGAARLYLPGLTEDSEDPYQHPLFLQVDGGQDFIKAMAARVLPHAFLTATEVDDFPRFAVLRDIAARQQLRTGSARSQTEQVRIELGLLKLEYQEAIDERDSWQALAQDEEAKRQASDAEVERLKEENQRLEAKASTLEHGLNAALETKPKETVVRELESYHDLEDWADEVLGERIYIHQSALRDCRKNGHDKMLKRLSDVLIVIRDFVVPARIHGGLERYNLANARLTELGMEDSPCFVNREEAKWTAGYSIPYDGMTHVLYDHIKYGNGYDNANQIRIYYFWDEPRRRFVIGKMPSHLRNNLTN